MTDWVLPIQDWTVNTGLTHTLLNNELRDRLRHIYETPVQRVSTVSGSNTTRTSTSFISINNPALDLSFSVAPTESLTWLIGFNVGYSLSIGGVVYFDVYETLSGVYLSTGTTSPSTNGMWRTKVKSGDRRTANVFGLWPDMSPNEKVFQIWVKVSTGTGTFYFNDQHAQLWAYPLGVS